MECPSKPMLDAMQGGSKVGFGLLPIKNRSYDLSNIGIFIPEKVGMQRIKLHNTKYRY